MKTNAKLKVITKHNGGGLPFTIERGIPVASRKKPNPYEGVFSQMKIGDSFLIGDDEDKIKSVHYQAAKWGKENDATFAFRNTNDGKRCWRIK